MQNYINDVQNTNVERAKVKDGFWSKVTRNFQSAVLVGNPGTPFKQKGSMWLAMSELDPRAVAKASVTSLNPWSKKMKEAREYPQIGYRALGNIDASISDALNNESTLIGKAAEKSGIIRRIVNWIPAADVKEVSKVYLAAYYDVQLKNPDMDVNSDAFKQKVDDTFTSACLHTQAQYNMNYRDEVSRSDNDLMKALTMFQTQQRANYNSLMTAFGEAKSAKGTKHASEANRTLKNTIGGFVASNVAYGLMNAFAQAIRHKLKPFRDNEDEEQQIDPVKILGEIGKGFAEGVGGTVMFGETATNALMSVFTGETFYENGVGAVGAIGDAVSAAVKLIENPSADNARKTAGNVANLAGIPLNNAYTLLNSMLMYAADIANAASTPEEKSGIDFLVEALKGTSAADVMGKNKTDLYKFSDDPADDTLKLLDSIRKSVNSFAPKEFTFEDGYVYELDKEEREQYRKTAETTYLTGVEALLATAGYLKLDKESREELRGAMKSYAKDVAAKDYLGFDEEWENNLSEKEVPEYLVGKKILTVSADEANYDAIDFLIGRFDKLKPNVQRQLKEQSGLNVSKLLYSDSFDVDAETYYNGKNAIKRGAEKLGDTDAAAAISVYNSMADRSDSEIFNVIKTQITPGSGGKPATIVRRIEAYNTIAGEKADLGKWLNLLAALNDADVNDSISKEDVYAAWANIGLSSGETYAGISRDDFYKLVKSKGGYASDENYATQFDEVYAALVPTEQEEKAFLSGSVRK